MRAMVCGGAGYIGSHMCRALRDAGYDVLVLDDLSTGHRAAVAGFQLAEVNILDMGAVDAVMAAWRPEVVFHFAARSIVRDSVLDPEGYHLCNVVGSQRLLESMRRNDVDKIVFSSSAAVYGIPDGVPITEDRPLRPINPYGETKAAVERLLADAADVFGLRSVSLRYFNAAGADPLGGIGESHDPETHLIPNALRAAAGQARLQVFGTDYATADGTCIRDYVHVGDLALAHLAAARYLEENEGARVFNLGTGNGCSVMEIIRAVERTTGTKVPFDVCPPRAGDPERLVASYATAANLLRWTPVLSDIDTIVDTAWRWHCTRTY